MLDRWKFWNCNQYPDFDDVCLLETQKLLHITMAYSPLWASSFFVIPQWVEYKGSSLLLIYHCILQLLYFNKRACTISDTWSLCKQRYFVIFAKCSITKIIYKDVFLCLCTPLSCKYCKKIQMQLHSKRKNSNLTALCLIMCCHHIGMNWNEMKNTHHSPWRILAVLSIINTCIYPSFAFLFLSSRIPAKNTPPFLWIYNAFYRLF